MEKFKVSVVIPTYKRSDMLPRAINSCLNQSYKNVEVIVVDDNNPETEWRKETEARMAEFIDDSRVVYIRHKKNSNGNVARNTGVNNSSGELITYLDDDDWFYPEKIKCQVDYLLTHPEHRAVYCGWLRGTEIIPMGEGDLSFGILSGQNIIITNSIMMWKKDTIECGGWDENLKRHQEASLLLNYFRNGGTFGRVPTVLVEFDITDRQNKVDPHLNEQIILYLLNNYNDLVERCDMFKKGSKKRIYCFRYKGIFYNYIVHQEWKAAIRVFLKMIIHYPITYLWIMFSDIYHRICKNGMK